MTTRIDAAALDELERLAKECVAAKAAHQADPASIGKWGHYRGTRDRLSENANAIVSLVEEVKAARAAEGRRE